MIAFNNVVKHFPLGKGKHHKAVQGVTFDVKPGEICCLLGPNGAGKTTSINMLLGFLPITDGDVTICGVSVSKEAVAARKQVAYIPDEVALYRNLSGLRNLRFFGALQGGAKRSDHDYEALGAKFLLDATALRKKVHTYSKGMRQRLAICVAMLKEAPVYVLDEPTAGLDAVGVKQLLEILRSLREQGKAVLVTTHDLLHVSSFASKVVFLHGGRIQQTLHEAEIRNTNLEEVYIDIWAKGIAESE